MSLLQNALSDVGISIEDFQEIPIEATESPLIPTPVSVDQPSVSIPISEAVVEAPLPLDVVEVPGVPITELAEMPEPCIDNAISEHEMLQDKADQLVALQTAMERYEAVVRKTGYAGITPQTAEAIQVHIQLSQSKLGISTKLASMESFKANGPREQHELATITLESIRETAKQAGSNFIAAIEKIIMYLKRLGQNLFDGLLHVDHALGKLDTQLKATKVLGGDGNITLDTTMLDDDGAVVTGAPPKIKMLAQFTIIDYPMRVSTFFDTAAKIVSSVSKDDDDFTEVLERLEAATAPLADIIATKDNSDTLPGGYTIDVSEGGLSFGVKAGNGGTQNQEVPVSTTKELRDQVRALKELVEQLKKIRPSTEKISASGSKLLAAAKSVGNDELLNKAATFIHQANPRVGEVIDYMVKYIKAQCVAIKRQADVNERHTTED